jgi:hypothetical protein
MIARHLKRTLLWIIGAAAGAYIAGCSSSPTSPSAVADISVTSSVVNGHSHTANVPSSDQLRPADMTYTTSTSLNHQHSVTLTAGQLATLASGGTVTVTSTVSTVTGSHQHDFTFQGKKSN